MPEVSVSYRMRDIKSVATLFSLSIILITISGCGQNSVQKDFEKEFSIKKQKMIDTLGWAERYFVEAEKWRALNEWDVAATYYQWSIDIVPTTAAYFGLGRCYFFLEDYDKADTAVYTGLKLARKRDYYDSVRDSLFQLSDDIKIFREPVVSYREISPDLYYFSVIDTRFSKGLDSNFVRRGRVRFKRALNNLEFELFNIPKYYLGGFSINVMPNERLYIDRDGNNGIYRLGYYVAVVLRDEDIAMQNVSKGVPFKKGQVVYAREELSSLSDSIPNIAVGEQVEIISIHGEILHVKRQINGQEDVAHWKHFIAQPAVKNP